MWLDIVGNTDFIATAVTGFSVIITMCTDILIVAEIDFRMSGFIQENITAFEICSAVDLIPRNLI